MKSFTFSDQYRCMGPQHSTFTRVTLRAGEASDRKVIPPMQLSVTNGNTLKVLRRS